jgi:hypothetical protein
MAPDLGERAGPLARHCPERNTPPLPSQTPLKARCCCSGGYVALTIWEHRDRRTVASLNGRPLTRSHNAPTTYDTGRKILNVQNVGRWHERILVPQPKIPLNY